VMGDPFCAGWFAMTVNLRFFIFRACLRAALLLGRYIWAGSKDKPEYSLSLN